MNESAGTFVERVPDEGQWFNRGERVEIFPSAAGHLRPVLEKAALGSYEVLGCSPVRTEGRRWLDVRLRSAFPTLCVRRRPARAAGVGPEASSAPGSRSVARLSAPSASTGARSRSHESGAP